MIMMFYAGVAEQLTRSVDKYSASSCDINKSTKFEL
jgi:hypothetical protein